MRVAILQPMYIPWMGYFGLIGNVDVFVFLDDAQFEKQSWQNRNRIKTPSGPQWLTIPVHYSFGQHIREVKVDSRGHWRKDHRKAFQFNYAKASFFREYQELLERMFDSPGDSLAGFTVHGIRLLCEALGIRTPLRFSSEFGVRASKTARLCSLLKKIGATEYVSGPAAKEYLDTASLHRQGIKVYWWEYAVPEYPQLFGAFVSHLTVLDLLLNAGPESGKYLSQGSSAALVGDSFPSA
ncbi:MAG: hypothetical protein GF333_05205 [Candidatus Omnitrophica bacterium]|nr:hypothetical protein [Candidatus Omnitrophota bacterium]